VFKFVIHQLLPNQTSNQERRPPEFKHIIKGRKRN
jgi:hypothetical protein